jgi:hypothetical protein
VVERQRDRTIAGVSEQLDRLKGVVMGQTVGVVPQKHGLLDSRCAKSITSISEADSSTLLALLYRFDTLVSERYNTSRRQKRRRVEPTSNGTQLAFDESAAHGWAAVPQTVRFACLNSCSGGHLARGIKMSIGGRHCLILETGPDSSDPPLCSGPDRLRETSLQRSPPSATDRG